MRNNNVSVNVGIVIHKRVHLLINKKFIELDDTYFRKCLKASYL